MSDIPTQPEGVGLRTYADDITTLSTHNNIHTAESQLQPYLDQIQKWTQENDLTLNADKSSAILFTSGSAQYNTKLKLQINDITLPTVNSAQVLGLTKITYKQHIDNTKEKHRNP